MIFAISGDGGGDRHMVAIKAGTTGDVTDTALVWEKKKETAYVPMVLAKGDYVFWISDKENKALCVEAKTGKVMWEERLRGSGQVTASPGADRRQDLLDQRGRPGARCSRPSRSSSCWPRTI